MTDQERRSEAAKILGSRGGKARARNMTPEQRSEAGRKAVQARWARKAATRSHPHIIPG